MEERGKRLADKENPRSSARAFKGEGVMISSYTRLAEGTSSSPSSWSSG
jgi:hypothetical protein